MTINIVDSRMGEVEILTSEPSSLAKLPTSNVENKTAKFERRISMKIDEEVRESRFLCHESDRLEQIPRFDESDFSTGELLGEGGFCKVYELKAAIKSCGNVCVLKSNYQNSVYGQLCAKEVPRYAIKMLNGSDRDEDSQRSKAMIEMGIEARFLAVCNHPNILSLRGMSSGDVHGRGSFIILEQLVESLPERMNKWKEEEKQLKISNYEKMRCSPKKQRRRWAHSIGERCNVMIDVVSAMAYLHSQNILHQDLKPDNLGFDSKGHLKLFDFGFSHEFHEKDKLDDDEYVVHGYGTQRYMAPEIALRKRCNLSADVFSFAILFWEIIALEVPFRGFTAITHFELVYNRCFRPDIPLFWPDHVRKLLERSWSKSITERPNMVEMKELLLQIIGECN